MAAERAATPVRVADLRGPDDPATAREVLLSALQQFAAAAVLLSYPVIVGRAAGADTATVVSMVSLTLLASGVGAWLQARRGVVGSGFLCWPSASIVYLPPMLAAVELGGLPLAFGMLVFAALCEIAVAPLMRRLRPVFPAEIAGLVSLLVGITSGSVGLKLIVDGTQAAAHGGLSAALAVATVAMVAMVALNVWGRGLARICCVLIGGIIGVVAAFVAGLAAPADFLPAAGIPWIGLPDLRHLGWSFDVTLMLPFAVAAIASMLKTAGSVVVLDRATHPAWVRADMRQVSGGVLADGLAALTAGLIGAFGVNSSATATGLAVATRMHSRRVATAIAALCVIAALLPAIGWMLLQVPLPVLGAMLVFSAAFMIVNGLEIITSRMLDARRTLVVGLGLVAGLSVELVPDLAALLSPGARALFGTPLVLGTVVALALNLAFRLGATRTGRLTLAAGPRAAELDTLMSTLGAAWGARRDAVDRTRFGVVQAVELLREEAGVAGPIELRVSFDEFTVQVQLEWQGVPVVLSEQRPTPEEVVESEDGVQRLAGFLLRRVADRAQSTGRDGRARLVLAFEQ